MGVAVILQSTKLVSAKMNFMAIREIYGPRKLPAIGYVRAIHLDCTTKPNQSLDNPSLWIRGKSGRVYTYQHFSADVVNLLPDDFMIILDHFLLLLILLLVEYALNNPPRTASRPHNILVGHGEKVSVLRCQGLCLLNIFFHELQGREIKFDHLVQEEE